MGSRMMMPMSMSRGIPEGRLRLLYDAIDTRQYRNALKLSSALLTKHPNSPYLLALKGLVLERMGKKDEALPLCISAKDSGPLDDLTLSTLQMVFHRLNRLDLATSCYEHACLKFPNNLELLMGLFGCYVREYSYVKQQQTAMKMYKLASEERFLFWAVCSIQLQVSCESGGEKLLSLAEALIKKHIENHGLHELEALLMYLSILEQQCKIDVALKVLDGDLGKIFSILNDKLRLQGKLLIQAHDYAAASDVLKSILETTSDDWEIFIQYVGCILCDEVTLENASLSILNSTCTTNQFRSDVNTLLSDEEFNLRIFDLCTFIKKLQSQETDCVRRGPFLADLEIEKRRIMFGRSSSGDLCKTFLEYFRRFGHLSSFVTDVEDYLKYIEDQTRQEFLLSLHDLCSELCMEDNPVKNLGRQIAVLQVEESFHLLFSMSNEALIKRAKHLMELFMTNLYLSRDLDPQEVMHGEELLSLASDVLLQMFWRTKHIGYLLEALAILEFGLTIRRHISQYRLSLVHIYSYWSAISCAFEWYKSLEIKNIMLESMSHHILPQLLSSPFWSELSGSIEEYLKFHEDYMKEAADLIFPVYRHCNYTKVLEFVKFKERLQNSHLHLTAKIELLILELKQKADNLEDVENTLANLKFGYQPLQWCGDDLLGSMSFNEDLQTRPWWTPIPYECLSKQKISCQSENMSESTRHALLKNKVRRRCLIPRLLQLSVNGVSFLKETNDAKGSGDKDSRAEMKGLLEDFSETLGLSFDESSLVLQRILLKQKSFKDLSTDLVDFISYAVFYNVWELSCKITESANKEEIMSSSFKTVQSLITLAIDELRDEIPHTFAVSELSKLLPPNHIMSNLFQIVAEPISWYGIVLQSCARTLTPMGRKKKKGGQSEGTSTLLDGVQNAVSYFRSSLETIISWLAVHLEISEDRSVDILLGLLEGRGEPDTVSEEQSIAKPGQVLKILESGSTMMSELGPRIGQAVETWSTSAIARKLSNSQKMFLSKLQDICTSKLKSFKAIKLTI